MSAVMLISPGYSLRRFIAIDDYGEIIGIMYVADIAIVAAASTKRR
jgi:hypothetical protein